MRKDGKDAKRRVGEEVEKFLPYHAAPEELTRLQERGRGGSPRTPSGTIAATTPVQWLYILHYSTRRFARPLQYIVEAQAHHICYGSPTRKKIQMRDAKVAKIYSTRLNEAQNETSTKNIAHAG